MRTLEFKQRKLISESWNDQKLFLLESKHIVPFVASIEHYITEAKLAPDQIQQLFTSAEQGMSAGGKNRTAIGKGVDVAKLPIEAVKFIDKKISELGKALQNSGPVKNIDAKFDELKAKIGTKDSKVVQGIKTVSDWAIANPGKATVAVAVLTTAAAMAGGPMGGAIAGFLARATKDLLQGEKLSTAVGKSVKTAAYGAIAGWALNGIGDWLEGLRADAVPYEKVPGLTQIDVGLSKTLTAPGFSNVQTLGSIVVPADQADNFIQLVNNARGGDVDAFKELWSFTKSFDIRQAAEDIAMNNQVLKELAIQNDQFLQNLTMANNAIAAIAQGTITGKMDSADIKVDGKPVQATESKKFTALQVETLIEWCDGTPQMIFEGPMDTLKKGAAAVGSAFKKGAAAVGAKAAQVGKNITTKVTADKLNKAWVAAGKPDDSDKIANVLRNVGVSDEVLAPIYKQMGATLPSAPKPAAPKPAAQSRATPTQGQAPAAPKPAAQGGATPTAPMNFKAIQQAVAKLDKTQASELVKHIDSLNNKSALTPKPAAPKPAAQGGATPTQGQAPAAQGGATPTQGQAPAAQGGATPTQGQAPAASKNAAAGDTYEKAKGDVRKAQSGTKPIPPKAAADIDAAIAKLAKGDKESGVFAAQKIMNLARAGVDISKQQQSWVANSKAGERFLTQSVYFEISKMLKEHKLSWSDLGIRVHLLEGTNKLFKISLI
jgi:hypothetical protein